MPTPEFITRLREKIGHAKLWLVGVTGFIRDDAGRVLLGKRTDTGAWALVSGINEPGEEPADTIAREAYEETGVRIVPEYLASVAADSRVITYENGDRVQYLELLYICSLDSRDAGSAHVHDEESLEVGWFALDDLPRPLATATVERIELAQRFLGNLGQGDAHALFMRAQG